MATKPYIGWLVGHLDPVHGTRKLDWLRTGVANSTTLNIVLPCKVRTTICRSLQRCLERVFSRREDQNKYQVENFGILVSTAYDLRLFYR